MSTEPKFSIGELVVTRGVNDRIVEDVTFARFVMESLIHHMNGDWGDLSEEEKEENEFSLDKHLRLFSAYRCEGLPRIWIITEADRSATTVLFPEEY